MLRLHFLSSSPVTSRYPIKPYPNLSIYSKLSSSSFRNKSICLHFSLTLNSGKNQLSVKCRQTDYFDQQRFDSRHGSEESSFPPKSPSSQIEDLSPRVFVNHSIYKGKAALTVTPRPPEFTHLDSGAFKVSKEGYLLLQFAPAVGTRQYDWNKKQVFSLSVTEIGNLICLGPRESFEFFHDPFKGKSEEGQVKKVLKAGPLPDGSGHFFNLSVQNKLLNLDESIYIPVTRAEFAVFISIFNYIVPYLLGWHAFANSIRPDDSNRVNKATPKYGGDFEWSR